MADVAITGAGGFLGWHTRAALNAYDTDTRSIPLGEDFHADRAVEALEGTSRVIHIAGVNRASEDEIRDGNILFATQLAEALQRTQSPPKVVVFANSTQVGNGSVYGEAKARAAGILAEKAQRIGAEFLDLRLPNLFGEHGRPFYNAVTSTFCHILAEGGEPTVENDKELTLLHAQDAADLLSGIVSPDDGASLERTETVSGLLQRLREIASIYRSGEIPDIVNPFARDLFNTYRSYTFPGQPLIRLDRKADSRGAFFEIIRSRGGENQTSFSTTVPGISRGDHYHRRKIERFTVLSGTGTISLRRLFHTEVVHLHVTGDKPTSVDMPTLWSHKIENTGTEVLYTSFWVNELYSDNKPDTVREFV